MPSALQNVPAKTSMSPAGPKFSVRSRVCLTLPRISKTLSVKKVGPGLYKYEAVCPDHGDRYVDCCTMSAHVARDGVVEIEGVKWDDAL